MRHESLYLTDIYLTDIVQAADHIAEFIAGADFECQIISGARDVSGV